MKNRVGEGRDRAGRTESREREMGKRMPEEQIAA